MSGRPVGFAAVDGDRLEQLYVDPDRQRRGIGRLLLSDAQQARPDGLWLRVFTRNEPARRFSEAAGFARRQQRRQQQRGTRAGPHVRLAAIGCPRPYRLNRFRSHS